MLIKINITIVPSLLTALNSYINFHSNMNYFRRRR